MSIHIIQSMLLVLIFLKTYYISIISVRCMLKEQISIYYGSNNKQRKQSYFECKWIELYCGFIKYMYFYNHFQNEITILTCAQRTFPSWNFWNHKYKCFSWNNYSNYNKLSKSIPYTLSSYILPFKIQIKQIKTAFFYKIW